MTLHHPTFGELLKESRRAAGLTQEMLAARAGLSARAISDLERNVDQTPRPGTVQLLIAALSLSPQERQLFEAAALDGSSWARADEATRAGRNPLAPQPDTPDRPGPRGVPPVVGRASEQALLERHLEGDGPPLLVFAGEAGIGKTRLLQEAMAQATTRGLNALHGTLPAVGQNGLRDPLVDALRQEIHRRSPVQLRRDLHGCAWLVRTLPELALGPIEPLPSIGVSPEQEGALTARAVMRFLANVAGPAGTLLTLDNLHHADAAALEFFARLVQSATDVRLRIVGAYRDSESNRGDALSAVLAGLAQEQLVRHVTLSPLAKQHAAELLTMLLEDRERTRTAWEDEVLLQAGGVPFYLVAWAQDRNRHQVAGAADDVPWAIQQSVRARIDGAPAAVRRLLEAMAFVGGRAAYPLLVVLAARPDEQVLAALETACHGRLVEEDGQAYRFAYDVIRTVVEADLSRGRRVVLGQRLAAVEQRELDLVLASGKLPGADRIGAYDGEPRAPFPDASRRAGARRPSVHDERAYHLTVLRRRRSVPSTSLQRPPDG